MTKKISLQPVKFQSLLSGHLEGAAYRTSVSTYAEDLAGAQQANQQGLTYFAARATVTCAALAFLAERGVVTGSCTDIVEEIASLGTRWERQRAMFAACDAGNPLDAAELRTYVDECIRFCASVGVRVQRGVIGRQVEDLPDVVRSSVTDLQALLSVERPDDVLAVIEETMERLDGPDMW